MYLWSFLKIPLRGPSRYAPPTPPEQPPKSKRSWAAFLPPRAPPRGERGELFLWEELGTPEEGELDILYGSRCPLWGRGEIASLLKNDKKIKKYI